MTEFKVKYTISKQGTLLFIMEKNEQNEKEILPHRHRQKRASMMASKPRSTLAKVGEEVQGAALGLRRGKADDKGARSRGKSDRPYMLS